MQIAKYVAGLSLDIDKRSFKEGDKVLSGLEKRFSKLGNFGKALTLSLGNFSVDQRKLNRTLGDSLDVASRQVRFEISQFAVNDRNMQAALLRAGRRIGSNIGAGGAGNGNQVNGAEWDRRRAIMAQEAQLRHQRSLELAGMRRSVGSVGRSAALGGASFASGASRLLGPALTLGLGGYGLSQANKLNQQVVSAQLQSQAVVQQAGGTAGEGQASFEWLRNQGNRIGFNYLDASADYNKLLSGLTGAGMSVQQGQGVFKGFSELSRVNKLDRNAQTRVYRALSQVAGKNKLQSEELTGQLAESLPGAVSIFARAYQNQLTAQGKGGGKVGQEAISELLAAMKKGQVKGDILTYAGAEASRQAAPGLAAASTASQAEQARLQNVITDKSVLASNSGVEEGFARIFRTLSTGLNEANGLVRTLAEGFNQATIETSKLLLFPQSFVRALEGRDSLVADWLGIEQTKQLQDDWSQIRVTMGEIWGMANPAWLPSLSNVAQSLKDSFGIVGRLSQRATETTSVMGQIYDQGRDPLNGAVNAGLFGLRSYGGLGAEYAGKGINKVLDTLPFARSHPALGYVGDFANYLATPGDPIAEWQMRQDRATGANTSLMYENDPQGWRDFNKQRNQAASYDLFGGNGYGPSQSSAAAFNSSVDTFKQGTNQTSIKNENKFDINVAIQTNSTDEFETFFNTKFQGALTTAGLQFAEKE